MFAIFHLIWMKVDIADAHKIYLVTAIFLKTGTLKAAFLLGM